MKSSKQLTSSVKVTSGSIQLGEEEKGFTSVHISVFVILHPNNLVSLLHFYHPIFFIFKENGMLFFACQYLPFETIITLN